MATSNSVWGFDIGQCALKALRCQVGENDGRIVADAFDYIEYPQILSQPDADVAALVGDALKTFLSRNKVKGDKIVVSVPGQSGLARFIKIPPVEAKKIPDLVKYEAKQQIPFALDEVIWDYQKMPGGVEEEGFVLDTEVGFFAMKRDQVFKALQPFREAGIEVDAVQLSPLAIYNFINFDQIDRLIPAQAQNGNHWVVVLSMGTDTTDLVLTNGGRLWQRSVPLGGNHFTKALTKQLKLTFPKAEHLKRNAGKAEDPKVVYQAMRSVFNDLVTEVHRSLSYFSSLEKEADIRCVVAMGNTLKLQGLQGYLAKSLEYKVIGLDSFRAMSGSSVVGAPAFKDNLLAYGVCYGLCAQGLGVSKLHTSLLPGEILTERLIRAKKPFAIAAAAALLVGLGVNFVGHWRSFNTVKDPLFTPVFAKVDQTNQEGQQLEGRQQAGKAEFDKVETLGKQLLLPAENRELWLEMLRAVNICLPQNDLKPPLNPDLSKRRIIYVDSLDHERYDKVEDWVATVRKDYEENLKATGRAPTENKDAAKSDAPATDGTAAKAAEPTGDGIIIQIAGHHFYNNANDREFGLQFVRNTMLNALETRSVDLPRAGDGKPESVSLKDLGISYPVLIEVRPVHSVTHPDREAEAAAATAGMGQPGSPMAPVRATGPAEIQRSDFVIQFVWKPKSAAQRAADKEKREAEKKQAAEAATASTSTPGATGGE